MSINYILKVFFFNNNVNFFINKKMFAPCFKFLLDQCKKKEIQFKIVLQVFEKTTFY